MQNLSDKTLVEVPWYLKDLRIKKIKWPYGLFLEEVQGMDDECWYFCDWLESGWIPCQNGTPNYLSRWGLTLSHIAGVGDIVESEKFNYIIDVDEKGIIEYCYIG